MAASKEKWRAFLSWQEKRQKELEKQVEAECDKAYDEWAELYVDIHADPAKVAKAQSRLEHLQNWPHEQSWREMESLPGYKEAEEEAMRAEVAWAYAATNGYTDKSDVMSTGTVHSTVLDACGNVICEDYTEPAKRPQENFRF